MESIILGIVQGLSEFLPISSSAHLILTSRVLGWSDQGLPFDVAANSGSLVAVVIFMRRELIQITGGAMRAVLGALAGNWYALPEGRLALVLGVATLPVAIVGWFSRDLVASAGRDPRIIAATSIVFALFLWAADRRPEGGIYLADIRLPAAVLIGLAQAMALVPGTSRAGVTLTAALLLGFRREGAVRFSFLLAVPVGLLVAAGELVEVAGAGLGAVELQGMAVAFTASAVSAFAAIVWLLSWIRRQSLQAFVIYRVLLGLAIVATMIW